MLSAAETQAVSALLAQAWVAGREIRAATPIWKRRHVIRLQVGTDRSIVLKRRGDQDGSFGVRAGRPGVPERHAGARGAAAVAADAQAGLLLMEDLGPGASLADALLAGDRERARADLVSYAEALGAMHAWSMGRPGELADLRARYAPQVPAEPGLAGRRRPRPGAVC